MKTILGAAFPLLLSLLIVGSLASPVSMAEGGEDQGKELFLEQKCNSCHAVPEVAIESKTQSPVMKGPDLPTSAMVDADRDALQKYLRREAEFAGNKHKKASKASDEELNSLLDWLAALPVSKSE